jgi:hypothetical protein
VPGDPLAPGPARKLLHSYRIKRGIAYRLHEQKWACEAAMRKEAPELFNVPDARSGDPVTTFLRDWDFDPDVDLKEFEAEHPYADHVTARHVKAHYAEITEALERHGWFEITERMHKAYQRCEEAYAALMAAPVTCADDILAKIEVRGKPAPEELTGAGDDHLFAAVYYDVRALAGMGVAA